VYGYSHHPQQNPHRPGFREDVCDDRYAGHAGDITDDVVQLPGSSVPKRFGCDGRDSKPSRLSYQTNTHAKILGERRADPSEVQPRERGTVVEVPEVGGLHHGYERRAA
jgi:hypothetical protein